MDILQSCPPSRDAEQTVINISCMSDVQDMMQAMSLNVAFLDRLVSKCGF